MQNLLHSGPDTRGRACIGRATSLGSFFFFTYTASSDQPSSFLLLSLSVFSFPPLPSPPPRNSYLRGRVNDGDLRRRTYVCVMSKRLREEGGDDDGRRDSNYQRRYDKDETPNTGGDGRRREGTGDTEGCGAGAPVGPKLKADFGLSGALRRDARTGNVRNGVELKWSEPSDSRVPDVQWRLYVYKGGGDAPVDTLSIHRQAAYLVGRDRTVVDLPIDHPSASKQHAVVQFRCGWAGSMCACGGVCNSQPAVV